MPLFSTLRTRTVGGRHADHGSAATVIVVPVRNEAQRIARCLDALTGSADVDGTGAHVILALNGCTDATWAAAVRHAARGRLSVTLADIVLSPRHDHAGGARAAALQLALAHLRDQPDGRIFTTDADTQVAPDWLRRGLGALDAGADAVAGVTHVASAPHWPDTVQRRHTLEQTLRGLLDEIDALCDPVAHDPWPTHRQASGANLAFRAAALRALPRLPMPRCGEDRALVQACVARDLRVRHDVGMCVTTSARLHGRARGGMADTLWRQALGRAQSCDQALEAVSAHAVRARLRAEARTRFRAGMTVHALAHALNLSLTAPCDMPCAYFGHAWAMLERHVPTLARRALSVEALSHEIEQGRGWLAAHRGALACEAAA